MSSREVHGWVHDGLAFQRGQTAQANLSTAPVVGPFDPGDNRDPQLVTSPLATAVEDFLLQQREVGFHRRVVTDGTDLAHRPVQVLLVQGVHE